MTGSSDPARPVSANYETKGSALRGYITALERLGVLPEILRSVSPETRAMVATPPPASQWIDARTTEELLGRLVDLRGLDAVRTVSHDALAANVAPLVQPIVQGLLRLFGTSPATLFARTDLMTRTNLRGVSFRYRAVNDRAGVMTIEFDHGRDVPLHRFVAFSGALQITLDMCGVAGTISTPRVVPNGRGNAAEYQLSW